jgi:dTDP-glucose 4,6-dehydratase
VVHFAAESHVDRSVLDATPFVRANLQGTQVLLDVSRARGLRKFVHVSTDEVYGSLGPEGLFTEDTPIQPNSPYSASKAGSDLLVRAAFHTHGFPAVTTRCSNNYGPYQFPEKLIPLMILNAVEGKPLPIYGDGGNVRDWIFVEDHCAGVLRVLRSGRVGEKYNLGGSSERTNLEIVDALCDQLERLLPARDNAALARAGVGAYSELKTFVPDRPGHDRRYAIDAGKARRELGWSPRHDLAQGLALTVRWYLEHRDWCGAVQSGSYQRQRLGLR